MDIQEQLSLQAKEIAKLSKRVSAQEKELKEVKVLKKLVEFLQKENEMAHRANGVAVLWKEFRVF